MKTLDVDFDVFKALTLRRATEDITENDVIRELLGLATKRSAASATTGIPAEGDWITKGVRFPVGTEFRANYKGQTHLARVANAALVLNGQRFDTPSSAAMSITGNPVNGWNFWECRLPGQASWPTIRSLRKRT